MTQPKPKTYEELERIRANWLTEFTEYRKDLRVLAELFGDDISSEFRYPHNDKQSYRFKSGNFVVTRYPETGSLHLAGIGNETKVRITVWYKTYQVANYILTNNPLYDDHSDFFVPGKWMEELQPEIDRMRGRLAEMNENAMTEQALELHNLLLMDVDI